MRDLGNLDRREMDRWLNNRVENSHCRSEDENARCSGSGR